ncbi:hypothetical protein [Streptomyces sp. gb1(2016)]|uniref:Uncharacterized protein n=1 Tax=Streptomyces sp. gb1(2016) TaxID=1828321 RepID=A0A652L9R6_9ACTN|nr:hypothetical protein [Streptomyces sp. gb1(2016)]TXS32795.1 hypothetical protein EAO74_05495 [Streptomyces sp. gb1(2016)]
MHLFGRREKEVQMGMVGETPQYETEPVRLRTDSGSPYTITVPHDVVTDHRTSACTCAAGG